MANSWFKFYGPEYLSDPKLLSLTAAERSCWITLLCYACVINDNGKIQFLNEIKLMIQAGLDFQKDEWDETKGILEKLKKLKMIQIDNEVITIINWEKRQETSLTGYERVKRYREKKQNDNVVDNTKITTDKIRIDKKRIDKNIVINKKPLAEQIMPYLRQYSESMLTDFSLYWTEPDAKGRERWEKEPTWDIKKRLERWRRQQEKWDHERVARNQLKKVDEMPIHREPVEERSDNGLQKPNFNKFN